MPYSAHIIYTALSTLYLRALHPDCMFAIKQLYNNHFNNKDMDVPFGSESFLCFKPVRSFILQRCASMVDQKCQNKVKTSIFV